MKTFNFVLLIFVFTALSFSVPYPTFAVGLDQSCTGINNTNGLCQLPQSCNVSNVLGSGNCDAGLVCCKGPQSTPVGNNGVQSTGNSGQTQSTGNTTGSPTTPTGPSITLINPLGTGATLNSFLTSILDLVIQIGSVVVILMLVYVGFLFVVARGNDSKLTEAKKALLWTVVGALILLGASAIAKGIQATVQALSVGK